MTCFRGFPWILMFSVCVLPTVFKMTAVPFFEHGISQFRMLNIDYSINQNIDYDVFAFSKLLILLPLALVCPFMVSWRKVFLMVDRTILLILVVIFGLIVSSIFSVIFSDFPITAVLGYPGHYEGCLAIVSYLSLCLGSVLYSWNRRSIMAFFFCLLLGGIFVSTVGFLQFFDLWHLDSGWIRKWTLGPLADDHEARLPFSYAGTISSTLSNPNFVGSFGALIFPISASLYLNKLRQSHILYVTSLCFLALLAGSHSRSGLLATILATAILVAWNRRFLQVFPTKVICLTIGMFTVYLVMGLQGHMVNKLSQSLSELTALITNLDQQIDSKKTNITVKEGSAFLQQGVRKIILKPYADGFAIFRHSGETVDLYQYAGKIYSRDPDLKDLSLNTFKNSFDDQLVKVSWPPFEQLLYLGENGFKAVAWGGIHDVVEPKKAGLFPDKLFSNRGYIWDRSLPLVVDALFFGHGYGVFALKFPQADLFVKRQVFNRHDVVITKPHNLYLQILLGGGMISLLLFLGLLYLTFYFVRKTIIIKHLERFDLAIIGAFVSGLVGYLCAGMAVDSTITVAPIFWICLGTLIGYCRQLPTEKIS